MATAGGRWSGPRSRPFESHDGAVGGPHERSVPGARVLRRYAWAFLALTLLVPVSAPPLAASSGPQVPAISSTGNPPPCRLGDRTTTFARSADWSRTLLDWTLRLPATYRPPGLVPVGRAGLAGVGSVRAELIPDLRAMAAAARAAGARLAVQSAYRSYATQVSTFRYWVARLGYGVALTGSARAGHSEHQLGVAIDFKSYGGSVPWSLGGFDWATTRAGRWLMNNAWRYGFVLSYPKGKQGQVCFGYEPWHYRYFGRSIAAAIHASGQTTRAWLWRHGTSPITVLPSPSPSPSAAPVPSPAASPTPTPAPSATPPEPSPAASPTPTPAPGATPPSGPDASATPGPSDAAPPTVAP